MSTHPRFARAEAQAVADEIVAALAPACERIIVAGSLRRGKEEVGDVEILYIGRRAMRTPPREIFARMCDLADLAINDLVTRCVIGPRMNVKGQRTWGEKNKLAQHCATGCAIDLFAATTENWWNYLVCRTGPAESNTRIAQAAQARGWKWNPYGAGFSRGGPLAGESEEHVVASEEDVFQFVGLPYAQPEARK